MLISEYFVKRVKLFEPLESKVTTSQGSIPIKARGTMSFLQNTERREFFFF